MKGSVVTITGGTGSFGSYMANHLLGTEDVGEIRIFSRDEEKQDAMRHRISDEKVRFFIGDTRDYDSFDKVARGTDYIFHAAALKQVPSGEFFPLEAVKTNINGSANVLRAAIQNQVKSVVCLSTDKAVYPINSMGMTKALMEKTAQAFARESLDTGTTISVTRYGNVMYSRGSVIPLFISQIKSGKPVTITDPKMTRFLMSLTDSIALVEYAFENAQSGDLFVKKAPAATIETIAKALIQIFEPRQTEPRIIGVRHGEKLYEYLLGSEERSSAHDAGDYFKVPMDLRDLNYAPFFEIGNDDATVHEPYTSHNTQRLNVEETVGLLLGLPEVQKELHS